MPTTDDINNPKPKVSWVKQLYYYLVLGFSILALSIGSYGFIRSNLTRFVFTDIEDFSYSYYPDAKCQALNNSRPVDPSTGQLTPSKPTAEEDQLRTECENKARNRQYQTDMLNSILTLVIAGAVLALHLKFLKLKD
jgi:hypothetical protein